MTSNLIAAYMKKNLSCSIVALPEIVNREYLSLAIAKNSSYLGILNHKYE
jgi:hypothetical protein